MSIYLLIQIAAFLVCAILSIFPSAKSNKIALLISIIQNILGIILFGTELFNLKDKEVWTGGFNIPNLQYLFFPLPLLLVLNILSLLYLFSFFTSTNFLDNILTISLINLHNFLLTVLVFVQEVVTLFFVLEFISLTNIGFILTSNNPHRKEVAIKYFIQNIIAGLLYIIGMIFFYRESGTVELIPFIASSGEVIQKKNFLSNLQYLLFFLFFFKLGIFPFHSWVSDVFQILDKKLYVVFFGLQKSILLFVAGQFFYTFSTYKVSIEFIYLVSIILLITILISVSGATFSKNFKRFLGYSSIYNAGFYLGLPTAITFNVQPQYTLYFFYLYLFVTFYIFSTYILFTLINLFELESFEDIRAFCAPYTLIWLFIVSNFLPFPLTIGFFAKVGIIVSIFTNGLINVGILLALSSVFAIYFYSRLLPPFPGIHPSPSFLHDKRTYLQIPAISITLFYLLINLFITPLYNFISHLIT